MLTATAAPPAASSSAIARPMLRPAPVMSATLPARSVPFCAAMSSLREKSAMVTHREGVIGDWDE